MNEKEITENLYRTTHAIKFAMHDLNAAKHELDEQFRKTAEIILLAMTEQLDILNYINGNKKEKNNGNKNPTK